MQQVEKKFNLSKIPFHQQYINGIASQVYREWKADLQKARDQVVRKVEDAGLDEIEKIKKELQQKP
jgi:hypothetical protein